PGTTANSTTNTGSGFLLPQSGPCAVNDFGFGIIPFVTLDASASDSASGTLNFGGGANPVVGFVDAVQGNGVAFNSPLQGPLNVANAAACRITGTLSGYPGTTSVPITGFLVDKQKHSFVLGFRQTLWVFNLSGLNF